MRNNPKILLIALCTLCIFCSAFSFTHSIQSNKNEFKITTDPHEQRFPSIYQNIVVWQDNRNGNWDIYGYNILTKEEFSIITDPDNQYVPAIYGDTIIYEGDRNDTTAIYGYSLSTHKKTFISVGTGTGNYPRHYSRNGDKKRA